MVVSHALIIAGVFSMILFFTHKFLVFELCVKQFFFTEVPYAITLTTKSWRVV